MTNRLPEQSGNEALREALKKYAKDETKLALRFSSSTSNFEEIRGVKKSWVWRGATISAYVTVSRDQSKHLNYCSVEAGGAILVNFPAFAGETNAAFLDRVNTGLRPYCHDNVQIFFSDPWLEGPA